MNSPSHRERLELAVRHHSAGRLREAVGLYQELLRATPNDADVMQRLGGALAELGAHEEGARWMAASLELKPDRPSVLLNLSRALLALGRAQEALQCAARALALDGSTGAGYRVRAAALTALGRHEEALANFAQAVRLAPADAAAFIDLGVALASGDRPQDAAICFQRAVELDPSQAPAHHNLGILAARVGDYERALQCFERALTLQPHNAALHANRGTSLKELGRLAEALESYSVALAIQPDSLDALHNRAAVKTLLKRYPEALRDYDESLARHGETAACLLGRGAVLLALDRNAEALASLQKGVPLLPNEPGAHIQLGVALLRLEQYAQAVASFDRALAIKRDVPEVLNNRGVALAALGRTDEALQDFVHAASLAGDHADTHTNMGILFKSLGRYNQAALSFDRALTLKRGDPAASFELAFLHLTLGEFRKGWPLYEARFRVPAVASATRNFDVPRWQGAESLMGKTLLVHAEQGLGDTIQFARYLPLLIERGARVVFEVMPQMNALLRTLPAEVVLIARGQPLPRVDFHCPLLSLPLAFDTQLTSIPNTVPYLSAQSTAILVWERRLSSLTGLRVGIAWQGNRDVERLIWGRGRSIPLSALGPLAAVSGVSLVSLQIGSGAEQLREVPFKDRILDLAAELDRGSDAFLDTAAVMANLDLIISSDTSIAHLAGALARPVWVALNATADWRWLLDRPDSPWYPTMRLFRQTDRSGGWDPVVADLTAALGSRAAEHRRAKSAHG